MNNIFGSVLDDSLDSILCFYINPTSQIQIARITNIPNYYWERVVFPGQQLMFTSVTSAILEVHTSGNTTLIGKRDLISCDDLYIDESETSIKSDTLISF